MAIFMTGATGFLGRYLLQGLLRQKHEIVLLVRGRDLETARTKVLKALSYFGPVDHEQVEAQVTVCLGELDKPGLALSGADRALVVEKCDEFLHCGASVRFDLPLEECRNINVEGTRKVLELARECQQKGTLTRIDYVGTAYVAGKRTGIVLESELDGSAGHKNTYEQTKFEAETVVREAQADLPITIYRPSIVTGDSRQGHTSSFKMIYWPARVYALGVWRICPGNPQAPIDLVPVNFVCDALLEIRTRSESLGRCFHLTSGPSGDVTIKRMAGLIQQIFSVKRPVRFVNPEWWMRWVHPLLRMFMLGRLRRVIRTGEFYVPYFIQNPRFDNSGTMELLAGTDVAIPQVSEYVEKLFRYCIDTDWGRKPLLAEGTPHSKE